jgi:hypothetical protein
LQTAVALFAAVSAALLWIFTARTIARRLVRN